MVKVTVIVLNYNGKHFLHECLTALLAQNMRDFLILFVDNASADGSVELVREQFKMPIKHGRMRIIVNDQNYGFAEGNNIGYRHVPQECQYVVLLNNDTRVRKDWLRKLLAPMEKYDDLALVGSSYYTKENYKEWKTVQKEKTYRLTMNLASEVITMPWASLHEDNLPNYFFVSGNGVCIRKKEFSQPFDPEYFAYAEDIYLGWLAHLKGHNVVVAADAIMFHSGGGTKKASSKRFANMVQVHGNKNQLLNPLLFYEWKTLLRIGPLIMLNQLGHLVDNPSKLGIKLHAWSWILTHPRLILHKRHAIQKIRNVPDETIISQLSGKFFDESSAKNLYNPTYQRIIRLLNWCSIIYCRIVRLKVVELLRHQKSS